MESLTITQEQCYDYANAGWNKLFPGTQLSGASAVNIPTDNKSLLNGRATVYKNTPSFLAKPGDMVVFNSNYGGGHGHVGWVLSATLDYVVVVEQNWLGGGWTSGGEQGGTGWETVTKRKHSYDFPMWFIRPKFKSATKAKKPTKRTTWNWKGRFSPSTIIKVRRSAGLKGAIVDKGSWLYGKNDWVDFVSITKKDGYWWIKFKYPTNPSAGYFYCAICKITDKQEKIKKEKYWGSIKWK